MTVGEAAEYMRDRDGKRAQEEAQRKAEEDEKNEMEKEK